MSNIVLNAGSGGSTLGTDQVTGVDYQICKIGFSVAGAAPVQVSASNALPVVQTGALPAGSATIGNVNAIQSGSWTVTVNGVVADATAFTRGTTVQLPVGGVVEAVQSSLTVGQTRALSLTQAALLRVDGSNVTQPVSGTITANIGTSGSLALDASVTGLQVAQGSTTSGQKGGLALGAVTTAAPSYTTAQSSALSLTTAGALRVDGSAVTQPVSGTVTTTPPANASTNIAQINGVTPLMGNGTTGTGSLRVTISSDNTAFSVNAIQSGTYTVAQGTPAAAGNAWPVTLVPQTGNGWSKFSTPKNNSNTALTNTVVAVKSSAAGELGGYIVYNPNASVAYIQVFDVATAGGVTLGTTRPDMVIPVPASSGANLEFANGVNFANGIQIAATTTDSGSTALGSGLTVTMVYK